MFFYSSEIQCAEALYLIKALACTSRTDNSFLSSLIIRYNQLNTSWLSVGELTSCVGELTSYVGELTSDLWAI